MNYAINLFLKNCQQLDVIQEVVLAEVPKLNTLVTNKE